LPVLLEHDRPSLSTAVRQSDAHRPVAPDAPAVAFKSRAVLPCVD